MDRHRCKCIGVHVGTLPNVFICRVGAVGMGGIYINQYAMSVVYELRKRVHFNVNWIACEFLFRSYAILNNYIFMKLKVI